MFVPDHVKIACMVLMLLLFSYAVQAVLNPEDCLH
jgi:hypothetical protein